MRTFWWLIVVAIVGVQPALAESIPDTQANRRAAAVLYLQAVPLKRVVDDMVVEIAAQLPEDQRDEFVDIMTNTIQWDVVEKATLASMVRHFTVQELNALADFQGSPEGQSVMKKFGAYMADAMPVLQQELVRALQQIELGNR